MIKTLIEIVSDEAATNPTLAAMMEEFNKAYEPVTYSGEMCDLCGMRVARRSLHDDWHRNLSLGMSLAIGIGLRGLAAQS